MPDARLFHRQFPDKCETPRHLGKGRTAVYMYVLFPVEQDGKEYGYLMGVCTTCMDEMSNDVSGDNADASQMLTPVFEIVDPNV